MGPPRGGGGGVGGASDPWGGAYPAQGQPQPQPGYQQPGLYQQPYPEDPPFQPGTEMGPVSHVPQYYTAQL